MKNKILNAIKSGLIQTFFFAILFLLIGYFIDKKFKDRDFYILQFFVMLVVFSGITYFRNSQKVNNEK